MNPTLRAPEPRHGPCAEPVDGRVALALMWSIAPFSVFGAIGALVTPGDAAEPRGHPRSGAFPGACQSHPRGDPRCRGAALLSCSSPSTAASRPWPPGPGSPMRRSPRGDLRSWSRWDCSTILRRPPGRRCVRHDLARRPDPLGVHLLLIGSWPMSASCRSLRHPLVVAGSATSPTGLYSSWYRTPRCIAVVHLPRRRRADLLAADCRPPKLRRRPTPTEPSSRADSLITTPVG